MTPATMLAFDGINQPVTEWALDYGIAPAVIIARLERGVPVAEAITKPMVAARGQKLTGKHIDSYVSSQRRVWWRDRRKVRQAVGKARRDSARAVEKASHDVARQAAREEQKAEPAVNRKVKHPAKLQNSNPSIVVANRRRGGPVARTLTHAGETLTVEEWSHRIGIDGHTIRHRLRQGATVAEALSSAKTFGPKGIPHTHDGKTMCVRAWARHTGITVGTLNYRLRKGMSIGEAITTPIADRFRPKGYMPSVGRPGVGQNSAESQGTGGHPFAQESAKLEISE